MTPYVTPYWRHVRWVALQNSRALRAWARQGRIPPPYTEDLWAGYRSDVAGLPRRHPRDAA